MAIATLKKIEILGHQSERDQALDFLQRQGQVEVIDLKDKSDDFKEFSFGEGNIRYQKVTEAVEKLSWLMSFFESVGEIKKSPLAPKSVLRRQELVDLVRDFDYGDLYNRCRGIESSLKEIEKNRIELESRRRESLPWLRLDVPLEALGETDFTASALGSIRKKNFSTLMELLESSPETHAEVVSDDKAAVWLFVAYLKSARDEVTELLKQHEFAFHHLPRYVGPVEEILKDIATREEQLESQRLVRLDQARALLPDETRVAALLDYFSNLEKKERSKEHLLYSQETFFLQGWIKEQDAASARMKLRERFHTVEVYVSDPSPDDILPVVLENRELIQPFEFLTRIYGYPAYQDVDPTPFLSPFFFVFFGFCLGDAIYGLIITLVSFLALRKFKLGWHGTRFFRLFLYCGLSTTVVGALTGGWMGDLLGIPALLVNPLKEPVPVLNLALIMGIIQILTGYAVAAYGNIRRGDYLAVLLDQVPVFVLLFGLTGIGLVFLRTIPAEYMMPSLLLVGAGGVVIVAAHGRSQPSLGNKVFFGFLSLYTSASGYLSDVLSYSRLWALGLVTAAMASTFNFVAATISKTLPVAGTVFAVIVLVVGHVFTLLINTLGAFIHTLRLQFVEFFSKFFKSTAKPFHPLSIENKFTVIEE